jgi:hypothetical protein
MASAVRKRVRNVSPKVVEQQEIKARAALHIQSLLGYHSIRVRRESAMEECRKT